ncbi:FlgO family outer membrane protein [Fundidesulfovibrio terrae]|uniref:FlgO family outer membrane protein n=1 Tax=Fundidesulfovibrio terrae TaxID=2922866 RepID=UPI001FAF3281|nr:FlgO family outer membrane protein [Fundidesulfovibrio terrae]
MRALALIAALATTLPLAAQARAQTIGPVDPGAQVDVSAPKSVTVDGVSGVRVRETPGASQGYMVPDASGGYVYYAPAPPAAPQSPSRADAEEIRLYARELASQITKGLTGDTPLAGVVSVPTAFVNQDTRDSSSFGRLMGEQMIYELGSRGFPVKEARGGAPAVARTKGKKAPPAAPVAVLAGSYYVDRDNLFVNARLVQPSGNVLRTGSVLIPMTPTLRRMLGIPDPTGLRPTPPTLIGARNVDEPPGYGAGYGGDRTPVPYSPSAKKKAPAKKSVKKAAKQPCPPGCEPIDTAAKAQPPQAPQPPAPGK